MANPTLASWRKLKRLGRYLKGCPRVVSMFPHQWGPTAIDLYVDTDFAGCQRTRRSTSGGVLMHGSHTLKTWSQNQSVIAMSSSEAEYHGCVKGATVGLGARSMGLDLGIEVDIRLHTDSSAARGISLSEGG